MKLTRYPGALGLAALAALGSPFAAAQDTGWYGGANLGRAAATIDDARIRSGLAVEGLTTNSIADRDRHNGYKVFGGYQLNRNFAVDLDERNPRVVKATVREGDGGSPSDTGWSYTVSGSDPEHFVVRPTTLTHDVTFTLLLQWAWNGKRGRLRIDDQGRPFRTTADHGAIPLCLNSTTTRLLPSPDGKPCAS